MLYVFSSLRKDIYNFYSKEQGGHRWQRVPPTESKGRVQTSSITVSVIKCDEFKFSSSFKKEDVRRIVARGSGNGGQNKNKRETAIDLTHIPTGIKVHSETQRTQGQNDKIAWAELEKRVNQYYSNNSFQQLTNEIRKQIGSGERGDKIRTYNVKCNTATDHRNNKKCNLQAFIKGNISLLH